MKKIFLSVAALVSISETVYASATDQLIRILSDPNVQQTLGQNWEITEIKRLKGAADPSFEIRTMDGCSVLASIGNLGDGPVMSSPKTCP